MQIHRYFLHRRFFIGFPCIHFPQFNAYNERHVAPCLVFYRTTLDNPDVGSNEEISQPTIVEGHEFGGVIRKFGRCASIVMVWLTGEGLRSAVCAADIGVGF